MRLALANKALSWEVPQRRERQCPSMCTLCKSEGGTICWFILKFPKRSRVLFFHLLEVKDHGKRHLYQCMKKWFEDKSLKTHISLPLIASSTIWLARESNIFEERDSSRPRSPSNQILFEGIKCITKAKVLGLMGNLEIDNSHPWAFFMVLAKAPLDYLGLVE